MAGGSIFRAHRSGSASRTYFGTWIFQFVFGRADGMRTGRSSAWRCVVRGSALVVLAVDADAVQQIAGVGRTIDQLLA